MKEELKNELKEELKAEKTKLIVDNFVPGAANELRYWKI